MVRKATLKDAEAIFTLISFYSKEGLLLPLTLSEIYENIRDFCVVDIDGDVKGCGALKIFSSELAEIRSVAVSHELKGRGWGRRIVEFCLCEAKDMGISKVFVLTTSVDFFAKCGFSEVDKRILPHKVWKDCIKCPRFPDCDEVAMIKNLEESDGLPC